MNILQSLMFLYYHIQYVHSQVKSMISIRHFPYLCFNHKYVVFVSLYNYLDYSQLIRKFYYFLL